MNQGAVENSANHRLRDEEWQAAACCVVGCCCCKGDYEMEKEAERGRFLSAAKARFAERAAGNELQQAFERSAFGDEERGRADQVQNAADRAGKSDYGERRQGAPHFVQRHSSAVDWMPRLGARDCIYFERWRKMLRVGTNLGRGPNT